MLTIPASKNKGDKEFKTKKTTKHFHNDFRHFPKASLLLSPPLFFSSDSELRHELVGGPEDKINTDC